MTAGGWAYLHMMLAFGPGAYLGLLGVNLIGMHFFPNPCGVHHKKADTGLVALFAGMVWCWFGAMTY